MINHDESWQVWVDKNQGCVIIIYRFEFHAKNIPIKLLKFLRTFLPLIFLFRWFFLIQKRPQMMDSFRSDLEICFNKKSEITTKKYPRVPEVKVMLGFIFNCVIAHQRLGLPRHTKFPFMLSHTYTEIERNSFFKAFLKRSISWIFARKREYEENPEGVEKGSPRPFFVISLRMTYFPNRLESWIRRRPHKNKSMTFFCLWINELISGMTWFFTVFFTSFAYTISTIFKGGRKTPLYKHAFYNTFSIQTRLDEYVYHT